MLPSENCDILVKDSAEIKAAAPGVAISMFGNLTVTGGAVTAESKGSNGIYAGGAITITNGAAVKASGYWPAIFAKDKITIDGSTVEAKSEADIGIYQSKKGDIEDQKRHCQGQCGRGKLRRHSGGPQRDRGRLLDRDFR